MVITVCRHPSTIGTVCAGIHQLWAATVSTFALDQSCFVLIFQYGFLAGGARSVLCLTPKETVI